MLDHLRFVAGESPTHALRFWEPVINGRPLREVLDAAGEDPAAGEVGAYVPVLVHDWPGGLPDDVLVLLGERAPQVAGRVPVYVCPDCGDLGCGAITVAVYRARDTVIWRDFGWDDLGGADDDPVRLAVPAMTFDRREYEAELRRFVTTFDQVRAAAAPRSWPAADAQEGPAARPHRWWPFRR